MVGFGHLERGCSYGLAFGFGLCWGAGCAAALS